MSSIVAQQSFEEKVMGRIRESIGELMSDEDLKRIVEKGIDRALFERHEIGDSWKAVNDAVVLGAGGCLMEAFNDKFRSAMLNMQSQITQKM